MIRTSTDFYSYLFQEDDGITAAYFRTITDTEYRVYFYPIHGYFDHLSPSTLLYHCGYFFGFTKLAPNEGRHEPLDFKIRNTILVVINDFFAEKGMDKVLVFYCDDHDGKKAKRLRCFDLWYEMADAKSGFRKYDEEIVTTDRNGVTADTDYLSFIVDVKNPNIESLLQEFQSLKEQLISNK